MSFIPLAGRILFSLIFILASFNHFTSGAAAYAASKGTPMANIAVPVSGAMALLGGVSILLGYKPKWGAFLIVAFLIPVTYFMHAFWTITEPNDKMIQQIMFMKNLAMLGGALFIFYFGSGPFSLNNKAAEK